ncbi:MAG: GNAT family N-acetyltransferase [Chloroflexota bacterium]|nr:GNAT family N-acetyltransferase [Chloroflexota bacterium]
MNTAPGNGITLENAPSIPGLTFRHFRDEEDYHAILDVNTRSKIADGLGHDLHTIDTLKYVYGPSPTHDPTRDVLMSEVDGKLVGFTRVFWERLQEDGSRIYWHFGFVVPEWRGKGIGTAQLRWAEARAREIEASHDDTHAGVAQLSSEVEMGMKAAIDLLTSEGYQPVRYHFFMETDNLDNIPDVPMPDGLEIRLALPEHYRAIWEANVEAFRDHWGSTEVDESEYDRFLANPRNEPRLWVVAWDGDQIAGSILNFVDYDYNEREGRKMGYTEFISVRRPWRRRGLARAMLARSMQVHRDNGMTQTALGVDTENPSGALHLYESMGYKVVAQSTTYRKPL